MFPPDDVAYLRTPLFVRHMEGERYRAWRALVAGITTGFGVRPALVHVPDDVWERYFAANEDAFNAVVTELEAVDG
jgi:DNA repair photolyase